MALFNLNILILPVLGPLTSGTFNFWGSGHKGEQLFAAGNVNQTIISSISDGMNCCH